jgi:hypothetical protein
MRHYLKSHLNQKIKPKRTKAFIEAEKAHILEATKEARKELAEKKKIVKESDCVKIGNHYIPRKIYEEQERNRKLELLYAKQREEQAKIPLTPEQEKELQKQREHEKFVDWCVNFVLNRD